MPAVARAAGLSVDAVDAGGGPGLSFGERVTAGPLAATLDDRVRASARAVDTRGDESASASESLLNERVNGPAAPPPSVLRETTGEFGGMA